MAFYPDRVIFRYDRRWEGWTVENQDLTAPNTICKIRLFTCKLLDVMYR